jgi:PAS domain S-box-containing protein
MPNKESSKAELIAEIERLQLLLNQVQQENTQLQHLLEITYEHSDAIEKQWLEQHNQLKQENENRLLQFLEAMPVGVVVLDNQGKIFFVNNRAEELLGKNLAPGVKAEELLTVYRPYIAGTHKLYPWKKLPIVHALKGRASSVDNLEILQGDRRIILEIWGTPIFDESGHLAYAMNAFQDITARWAAEKSVQKHQQQQLASLEIKFHDLAANVPGIIFQWYQRHNGEQGFYYVSQRSEEFCGIKAEILLQDFTSLPVHPEDLPQLQTSIKAAAKQQSEWNFEGRFVLPNGEIKWWRGVSKPVQLNQQETVFNGVIIDITEQKALEKQLRENEATLEDAQRMASVGHWIWDVKTQLITRSAQDCRNYDINPNDYIPTYEALIEPVHPDDKRIIHSILERNIMEGETAKFEFRVICPTGQIRTLRSQIETEWDAQGKLVRLKGFSQDITEQKRIEKALRQSEERLLMAIESINDGFAYYDAQDRLVLCNSHYKTIFGDCASYVVPGVRFEEILRRSAQQGRYLDATGRVEAWIARRLQAHRDGETIDQQLNDGRWIQIAEQRTKEGGYVGLRIDITERKRAEKKLQQQNIELQNKNQELEILTQKLEQAQREQLYQLNQAYERFVPHELLKLLDKKSVIEVQLGDNVEKEMTILFSDIRGFTALSEIMTPRDNFAFINAYLSRMVPVIAQHRGVIDKYIGDAIMALFPHSADDAVQASIEMLITLNAYNTTRGRPARPKLNIGIGLNTGPIMLGTVGDKTRMDGTVIADAVNVASRVEELTKNYNTSLLITEPTLLKLKNLLHYKIRVIDRVKVKGKSKYITVYEIMNADPQQMMKLKLKTLHNFEQGFMCFHNNMLEKAQRFFQQVLDINKDDKAAQVYFMRCQQRIQERNNC